MVFNGASPAIEDLQVITFQKLLGWYSLLKGVGRDIGKYFLADGNNNILAQESSIEEIVALYDNIEAGY